IRYWTSMGSLGDDYPFEFTWINLQNEQPVSKDFILKEIQNLSEDKFNKKYKRRYEQLIGASRLITKIWNAYRFLYLNLEKIELFDLTYNPNDLSTIDHYYFSEFNKNLEIITNHFEGYNWHEAVMNLRGFFWNDLCDNYIEVIKYKFYSEDESTRKVSLKNALILFYNTLKLFSVIMPFITEEIYHNLYKRFKNLKSIHLETWAEPFSNLDENLNVNGRLGIEIIKNIRNIKSKLQIPLNQDIPKMIILSDNIKYLESLKPDISNTLRINELIILHKDKSKNIKKEPDLREDYKELGVSILFFK
ncbi:MAG: class I tRNA ligase family protein, partial [Candidatus Thorarchaeota archaeon]